jgi:hypothetical protein
MLQAKKPIRMSASVDIIVVSIPKPTKLAFLLYSP